MSVSSRLDSSPSPLPARPTSSAEQGILLVHLARARKLLQQGKYDVARQELELALLARPNDEDVLNLLSVAEFKRGNYHEAGRAARTLLRDNPGSAILHANLGLIQFKAGVLGEAEQELRRAIELQPDHARSHLHLGLLYRMRGKLGLALEHLRFAGAKRVVAEIEEALRKQTRPPAARAATRPAAVPHAPPATEAAPQTPEAAPQAPEAPPQPPAPAPQASEPVRHAPPQPVAFAPAPVDPARAAVGPGPLVSTSPATPGTEFLGEPQGREPESSTPPAASPPAAAGLAAPTADDGAWEAIEAPFPEADLPGPDARLDSTPAPRPPETEASPLFLVRPDGGLEITSRDVVFVRRGSVVWYSGKMRFAPEASFRGTRLEKILRADGKGHLFVNDPGRQAFKRDLAGQSLFVEGSRVLALDHGLSFRLEPVHDFRMNRRVDVLKIHGTGSVVLSVGGALLAHEVSPDFPLSVSSRDLVAWTGDLVPSVLEDRFLEEVMMPDVGSAPKIRFEGTGTVLTEPPRPRRRASDVPRGGGETDRRTS
ncbi:MAG: tetratricopeptide repeat protein [Acidobacteriota bacterium]|nr:tetratricopeptide repeat protein [Acidobacteriota bacterium]